MSGGRWTDYDRIPACIRQFIDSLDTFDRVANEKFASTFYEMLFNRCPQLEQHFPEPEMQQRLFVNALENLNSVDVNAARGSFRKLIDRHKTLGVDQYVDDLWCAFRDALRQEFPTEPLVVNAWLSLLQSGLRVMFDRGERASTI